jgi:predicted solute-binding protein
MYVNEQTLDYGDEGREAIRELLSRSSEGVQLEWAE